MHNRYPGFGTLPPVGLKEYGGSPATAVPVEPQSVIPTSRLAVVLGKLPGHHGPFPLGRGRHREQAPGGSQGLGKPGREVQQLAAPDRGRRGPRRRRRAHPRRQTPAGRIDGCGAAVEAVSRTRAVEAWKRLGYFSVMCLAISSGVTGSPTATPWTNGVISGSSRLRAAAARKASMGRAARSGGQKCRRSRNTVQLGSRE